MSIKNDWMTRAAKSGLLTFLLPIFYVLILNVINVPPFYLIVLFLIAIIYFRFKLTKKKRTILTSLGYFILSGIFIRTVIQEFRYIASDSTIRPTLQTNDRVIIDKLKYQFQNPQHGDIILFTYKDQNTKYDAIIRVIGLPYEIVEVRKGNVYVNGSIFQENYIKNSDSGFDLSPVKVPRGNFLVLGDNRNNSQDNSFKSFGFVTKNQIIGKVKSRFWPIERISLIK